MIAAKEVIEIHRKLIVEFGGSDGIRDHNLLESALTRPYMTFDGEDLYPTPVLKAAAILESIVKNHPFIDGNKRIGYYLMRGILRKNRILLSASKEEKYDFVIKVAESKLSFEEIASWIESKVES